MANQQGGQFLANTQTNQKEQCKAITIRCEKQVGSDVTAEAADNQRKTIEVENVVEASEDRSEERVKSKTVTVEESVDIESMKANEKLVEGSGKKQAEKGQNWRKIEEGIPLKHVLYPHAPSRREAERQFIRFTEILKNLQINIPFTEAMR